MEIKLVTPNQDFLRNLNNLLQLNLFKTISLRVKDKLKKMLDQKLTQRFQKPNLLPANFNN